MIATPTIFADAESCSAVCIRIEGKGSFENSPVLREFSRRMMEAGRKEFVIDLRNCPSMDSTFMGTLAAIAIRIRDSGGGGGLWVVNRNERNAGLLEGLGLDTFFSDQPVPVELNGGKGKPIYIEAGKGETRQAMREAHEACVTANPENLSKFKDVIESLKASASKAGSQ